MTIGQRIGMIAKEKNINLHQLAQQSGISYNTLYSIVRRKSNKVDPTKLAKIAEQLGVSLMAFYEDSFADPEDFEFIKTLGLTDYEKLREYQASYTPLPDRLAALKEIINYSGYNLRLIHGDYYFTAANGGYRLTETQVEELFNDLAKYAEYLCAMLEKENMKKLQDELNGNSMPTSTFGNSEGKQTDNGEQLPESENTTSDGK